MSADPLRMLISYWYFKDRDLDTMIPELFDPPYPEIFADSGAYSAMTQGSPLDLGAYAAWLKRYKHWFTLYANLDVIRHADVTWANQVTLEDKYGLTPLPVFHVAEEWSWLERYIDRYPYIALGVAGRSYTSYMGWLVRCFQRAAGRSVFHGFGIAAWEPLKAFAWYSVDTSSWGEGFRWGRIPLFDPVVGKFHKGWLGNPHEWGKLASLVRTYGFVPEDFSDRLRNTSALNAALAACSYRRCEQWLRARHGTVTIPEPTAAGPGLRLYLACSSIAMHAQAHTGLKLYLADNEGAHLRPADVGLKLYLAAGRFTNTAHQEAFGAEPTRLVKRVRKIPLHKGQTHSLKKAKD